MRLLLFDNNKIYRNVTSNIPSELIYLFGVSYLEVDCKYFNLSFPLVSLCTDTNEAFSNAKKNIIIIII